MNPAYLNELTFFFKKLEIIRLKYSAEYEATGFNVFSILRQEHDEVHLHSAFIAELLNPRGSHGFGSRFLGRFLQALGVRYDGALDPPNISIEVERRFPDHGQIDIIVKLPGRIVILENKIHAVDQPAQLERYFSFAAAHGYRKEQIALLYLTLGGNEPSLQSLGKLDPDAVTCISYAEGLLRWLTECIHDAALSPALRETIVQYTNLIKKLTGNSMTEANTKAVLTLLAQGDNALLGKTIIDAWGEMKFQTTLNFWQEFEARLGELAAWFEEFKVLPLEKYDTNRINGLLYRTRGRDIFFGLCAKLRRIQTSPADAIALYIEIGDGTLYFVLTIIRDETKRDVADEPAFAALADQVQPCSDPDFRSKWSLGGRYFKSRDIDFFNFRNEDTIALANPQRRKETIDALFSEIVDFMNSCGMAAISTPDALK